MVTIYFVSMAVFLGIILLLVGILFIVESRVVNKKDCKILINNDESKSFIVASGTTLLSALSNSGIFIPSACGGGGSCGLCKVKIDTGYDEYLPTELPHLTRSEQKEKIHVGCQVKVKNNLNIHLPDEIFNIKKFECEVVSNHNVATFIKELVLKIPENEQLDFKAGGYIQIDIPPYESIPYRRFEVEDEFKDEWDLYKVWDNNAVNEDEAFRAYSMANYPEEKGVVILNVRIATPPPRTEGIPPGIGSSYIFDLKKGDTVTISGPYGDFYAKETKREMCFIGGGAGMAPMRSHIFDQLKRIKSDREITFWYGARSKREMFYDEEFKALAENNPNFTYHVALSEPKESDHWEGYQGFIHQVLQDKYLNSHEDPCDIEFYLCGPPMMLQASMQMLDSMGVDKEMIAFDDFGS
ncbi:MAG: NADH:ubiquinone reductase (Na(+)-transporting) subunit F [Candidatus Margulisbacteria bacterium]|nr:NADH:ubiquinone reductase (Na(+)-transporting) subunit F [Candidatus Margulisiibacteriota bacterium]